MKESEIVQRQLVVEEAKTWLGTPYIHMGRVKGAGTDCGMLLLEVFEKVGLIPHIDPGYYPMDWHLHRGTLDHEKTYLKWVEMYTIKVDRNPLPGDIVLYNFGRCPAHGAIVIDWPLIIHSYVRIGVTYGEGDRGPLQNRLYGVYSFWR